MEKILQFIGTLLLAMLLCLVIVFAEDREWARQDFVKCDESGQGKVEGCFFQMNCDHFNKMLEN